MGKDLESLKIALQTLAMDAEDQWKLPKGNFQPAKLALEFVQQRQAALSANPKGLTSQQDALLEVLDHLLKEMSADPSLWTEKALRTHSKWIAVRELAAAALTAFNWPLVHSTTLSK